MAASNPCMLMCLHVCKNMLQTNFYILSGYCCILQECNLKEQKAQIVFPFVVEIKVVC